MIWLQCGRWHAAVKPCTFIHISANDSDDDILLAELTQRLDSRRNNFHRLRDSWHWPHCDGRNDRRWHCDWAHEKYRKINITSSLSQIRTLRKKNNITWHSLDIIRRGLKTRQNISEIRFSKMSEIEHEQKQKQITIENCFFPMKWIMHYHDYHRMNICFYIQ